MGTAPGRFVTNVEDLLIKKGGTTRTVVLLGAAVFLVGGVNYGERIGKNVQSIGN